MKNRVAWLLSLVFILLAACPVLAQRAAHFVDRPAAWYKTAEAANIAANVLSHQSALGGWPKNTDTASKQFTGDPQNLKPTFDNGATTDELRFLARMTTATDDAKYKAAFDKGCGYVLSAQYPNGGWPQSYPPGMKYHRHITYNDNAMVRLMEFLRETWTAPDYGFLDEARKKATRTAFERGIQCILKCQVKVNGKLTAWCAQHDELDLRPQPARAYELASLSGSESVGLVRLLMSLEEPSPEVVQAVDAAVAWFELAKCKGVRVVDVKNSQLPKGRDRVVRDDSSAPPLWARFYEIETNRPLFCDRDGVKKYALAEIGPERRNGYSWYGDWPKKLLHEEYPAWKKEKNPRP
jgi:pectate lyase